MNLDPSTKALAVLVLTAGTRDFLREHDPKALAQAHKALIGSGCFIECEECYGEDPKRRGMKPCETCRGNGILKADGTPAGRVETAPRLVVE
jgi:hypothetical protein